MIDQNHSTSIYSDWLFVIDRFLMVFHWFSWFSQQKAGHGPGIPHSAGAGCGATKTSRGPAARHAGDAKAQRALGRLAGAAAGENDRGILLNVNPG